MIHTAKMSLFGIIQKHGTPPEYQNPEKIVTAYKKMVGAYHKLEKQPIESTPEGMREVAGIKPSTVKDDMQVLLDYIDDSVKWGAPGFYGMTEKAEKAKSHVKHLVESVGKSLAENNAIPPGTLKEVLNVAYLYIRENELPHEGILPTVTDKSLAELMQGINMN